MYQKAKEERERARTAEANKIKEAVEGMKHMGHKERETQT